MPDLFVRPLSLQMTVVIPFYRGHGTLLRLLDSLPDHLPVIVVDDGYSEGDSFPDLGERENGRVSVIHLRHKGYFAGAVNAGIRACTTDVLVLNQDVWFEGQGWLEILAHERVRYALIGERIRGEHPAFPQGYIHGTFMYLRRDAIDAVGLLNARDYPLWGNTAEWQWRAARKGFGVLPLTDIPGFRHGRKPNEKFGASISHLLAKEPDKRSWLVRTPPLVSVIVPCYNYGRYLHDCIASLIGGHTDLGDHPGQTVQSLEIIIVDDASTDNSAEIGAALADDWKGIRFYGLSENVGTARALNYGIERAAGQYITFLSADDMREPDSLEKLVRACEEHPHSFAYDDVQMFGAGKRLRPWRMQEYDFELLLTKNHVHAGILYPRQAWVEAGGYPPQMNDGREDWAFNLALGQKGWCGVHVRHYGYLYRREGQNRSLTNTTPWHRDGFLEKIRGIFPHLYEGKRPMGCCGGKKTTTTTPRRAVGTVQALSMPGSEGMVRLEYVGQQQISTWTGDVTNTAYRFGATRRVGWVDVRDAGERPVEGRAGKGFLAVRRNGQFLFQPYQEPTFDEASGLSAGLTAEVSESGGEMNQAEPEPAAVGVPDPNTLTVAEIKTLELTPEHWNELRMLELAGQKRRGVLEYVEKLLAP